MTTRRRSNNAITIVVAIFVTLLLGALLIHQRQAIYTQLYDWKLIPRNERITEVYFTDSKTLPETYFPSQQSEIRFSIHNLETETTTYNYVITQEDSGSSTKSTLATGDVTLDNGKESNIVAPVTFIDMGENVRINISVSYQGVAFGDDNKTPQNQNIYYLLKKEASQWKGRQPQSAK